jgi:hypothetical protein
MIIQAPLIFLGRKLNGTFLGNSIFWGGMVFGPPSIYLAAIIHRMDITL